MEYYSERKKSLNALFKSLEVTSHSKSPIQKPAPIPAASPYSLHKSPAVLKAWPSFRISAESESLPRLNVSPEKGSDFTSLCSENKKLRDRYKEVRRDILDHIKINVSNMAKRKEAS